MGPPHELVGTQEGNSDRWGAVDEARLPAEVTSTTEVRRAPGHWQGVGSPSEHSLSLWVSLMVCLVCALIIYYCVINHPKTVAWNSDSYLFHS